MEIKKFIKEIKAYFLYGSTRDSNSFIRYLKRKGCNIGVGVVFYAPSSCVIDVTNPKLVTLGNYVRITHGVVILTHDFSWSVVSGVYGACIDSVAPVHIGNNVFLGMNSIVLKGVTIGDNVIIGAGSVVTKDCESNSVYAGNPAKKICDLKMHFERIKKNHYRDALRVAYLLRDESREVIEKALAGFAPLYCKETDSRLMPLLEASGYYEKSVAYYMKDNGDRCLNGIDELLKEAKREFEGENFGGQM